MFRFSMKRTVMTAAALLALTACGGQATAIQPTPIPPVRADERVVAEARVVPARSAALAMNSSGVVANVLVAEGDTVQAQQVLLVLDTRRQEAIVAQAAADKARAEATLARLKAGPTEEEIIAAEAQVQRAEAQLQQVRGNVTDRDILAAEARLQQARARLAEIERASNRPEVVQAGARLEEARATLEAEKARLSAAKTDARLRMEQAVEALTRAQSAWVVAKNEWDSVQADGQHPTLGYGLNEAEKRKFYDAFIQAETALRSAESSLEQARVAYDAARQAEAAGVSAAGQRVAEAQAAYDRIVRSTNNDELAAARAEVADAQARLERLRGEERAGAIAVAEATLAEARANLARLKAGPTAAQIAEAEADVRRATAALQAAQTQLDELTLRAPFGGLIAAVNIKPGEYVTPGTPLITIGDPGAWQIETTDLTELSIVKVQPDAPVTITFDALPGLEMQGRVTRIRELGENRQGDITYRVIITPAQHNPRLRWNMTASVAIGQP
jgi:HlyD family secretion protein